MNIYWHTASFKIGVSKVYDFGDFELSPMPIERPSKNLITDCVDVPADLRL